MDDRKFAKRDAPSKEFLFADKAFRPSDPFRQYLDQQKTVSSIDQDAWLSDGIWLKANDDLDKFALSVAQRQGKGVQDIFEKLFIWRTSCLETPLSGFVDFADLFPLSAYFDLKALLNLSPNCHAGDQALQERLIAWRSPQ